ncbi:MAG TPA: hypothetical protein VH593_30840 [Ktedonobacteraceae bacterium]|jgi:hypothetical protein
MATGERVVPKSVLPLQYAPTAERQRLSLREAALLILYHLRLLNWWLFVLILFGFVGFGAVVWLQLRIGGVQGTSNATELSLFVLEPGVGLFAGILTSSLVVNDPTLEVTMATPDGIYRVVAWRYLLTFFLLLLCSSAYLAWSLENRISYAQQQSPLFLLLLWLAPVLLMSMLGLFGSLVTHNAALGMAIATIPLAGSLFLYEKLSTIQATHPFFLSYTYSHYAYSGEQVASDWWTNRLVLLGIALVFTVWNWWLLRREEHLLGNAQ